ncbi:MAG: NADH-quinone oxidoreductase subunit J [Planctomycetota bacterium]|nr:NADH-quinone oxidoreductase subunit J [Planctomycetota bacterium]
MDPKLFLTASVICIFASVAMWMLVKANTRAAKGIAAIVGIAAFLGLLSNVGMSQIESTQKPEVFFYLFSLIAIACSVMMITSAKPVYSALYFVMVVLSSASLFLLLQAEFMAFALIIVYAGAILITYMFVLMLAQQASDPEMEQEQAEYDVNPREPAAACIVGFVMLTLLSSMIFQSMSDMPTPPSASDSRIAAWQTFDSMLGSKQEIAFVQRVIPAENAGWNGVHDDDGNLIRFEGDEAYIQIAQGEETLRVVLEDRFAPSNVELVGFDLIAKFPVSLELAGVILLMAMFGAVILARRQIELSEDEVREAAGMARISFEALEPDSNGGESP